MIQLLIYVLVILLIFGVIFYVIDLFPGPPNFKLIAKAILALVLLLVLLDLVLGGGFLQRPLRLP
jgi:hypothetical protein